MSKSRDTKGRAPRGKKLNLKGRNSRSAKYQLPKDVKIEYKNLPLLQRYLTDRGKIVARRITGITGKEQREMTMAINRARYLGLLPVGSSKRR